MDFRILVKRFGALALVACVLAASASAAEPVYQTDCNITTPHVHYYEDREPLVVSSAAEEVEVVPFGFDPCDNCPNGRVYLTRTRYGSWMTVPSSDVPCVHGGASEHKNDYTEKRMVTDEYRCDACNAGFDQSYYETRTVCGRFS